MWVTKLLISQVKKKDFLPQNDQIWPKIGIFGQFGPGHAGFFGALLVGRLVVVARAVSRKTPIYFISLCNTGFPKKNALAESSSCKLTRQRDPLRLLGACKPGLWAWMDCRTAMMILKVRFFGTPCILSSDLYHR